MKKLLLLLPLLLWAGRAEAAIAATGQQCNANGGGSRVASVSCTVSVTSGNFVVLMGMSEESKTGNADANGCSDNQSNTYVYVTHTTANSGIKMCSSQLTHTASTTFTWTNQGGNTWAAIVVIEFSGITTGTALDQATSNNNSTGSASTGTTSATTNADDVIVAQMAINASGTLTCGAGFTQIAEDESFTAVSYSTCYKIVSATGTQTMTWTNPSPASWSAGIGAFKGASTANPAGLLPWLIGD